MARPTLELCTNGTEWNFRFDLYETKGCSNQFANHGNFNHLVKNVTRVTQSRDGENNWNLGGRDLLKNG